MLGTMRVLIADDSPIIVERLIQVVGKIKGIERLDQADSVATASEAVRRLRPDVVILDMQMPGGSGLDVLKVIREDRIACAVIVLTNFVYPQYRRKCLDGGAQVFLDKSTEFEKVSELVHSLGSRTSSGAGLDQPIC
jgi:DNA-binding NarL/FixJ family response regulator